MSLMQGVDDMVEAGVNCNTSKGEDSAWHKYYLPYCRNMRTAPWREHEALRRPRHEGWRHLRRRLDGRRLRMDPARLAHVVVAAARAAPRRPVAAAVG